MENVSLSQLASWLISMLDLFLFSTYLLALSPSSYPSIFFFFHFIKNTQQYKTFASFSFLGMHNQDKCKMPFLRLYWTLRLFTIYRPTPSWHHSPSDGPMPASASSALSFLSPVSSIWLLFLPVCENYAPTPRGSWSLTLHPTPCVPSADQALCPSAGRLWGHICASLLTAPCCSLPSLPNMLVTPHELAPSPPKYQFCKSQWLVNLSIWYSVGDWKQPPTTMLSTEFLVA